MADRPGAASIVSNDYYLSVIMSGARVPEVRTTPYSDDSLEELLKYRPAAMTIARSHFPAAERLLAFWRQYSFAPSRSAVAKGSLHLHYYHKRAPSERMHFVRAVTYDELRVGMMEVQQDKALWGVFILAEGATECALFETVFDPPPQIQVMSGDIAEAQNRQRLELVNQEMMQKAGGYLTSEELAMRLKSRAKNPSQFAADQRAAHKVLAMRWGAKDWWYPRFQFEPDGKPAKEISELIAALQPDERGWDRLQWFLLPHEHLQGKTPLELWRTDRNAVLEAARTERWDARD